MIHVFLGTKAQYIKTAPLLRLMDEQRVPYRLIDSGQHGALSVGLREELGVRDPDHLLASGSDIDTIPQALRWAARIALRLVDRGRLRREVFGGHGGICVVHGDTPSTLLATLLARRAGLRVAHLEAGLRSRHAFHPFPEELIRRIVMRLAALLFAPDAQALANLRRMRVRGEVVALPANTVVEALAHDLGERGEPGTGPALVTLHRVENLGRRERVEALVRAVEQIAAAQPVRFVLHGPTRETLARRGWDRRLSDAGVQLRGLAPHGEFTRMLHEAPFVITDGGSIQEECALLGVPTLLWRAASERPDGLGRNVVLSRYRPEVVRAFLDDPATHRVEAATEVLRPSEVALERVRAHARER